MGTKAKRKAAGGMETISAASEATRAFYAKLLDTIKGNSCQEQRARLAAALKIAPVTTFDGRKYLDVYDVPRRIMELRAELRTTGWRIYTTRVSVRTDAGVIHPRVGRYVLTVEVRHD